MKVRGHAPGRIGLLATLLLLAACGSVPERDDRPGRHDPPPVQEPRGEAMPSAVRALGTEAERHSAAGDHDIAAARLERALRVAPRNPVLWQNLAVVRYRQGDYDQAESLAERSNAFAGGDRGLQAGNWDLIAAARRLRGDAEGASEATERARELGGAGR